MEDQPYDFIDGDAPEKRERNRKFAEAMEKNRKQVSDHKPSFEERYTAGNNSNNNNGRSDRDKTSNEKTDKVARSNRPLLVRVIDKLFKLFE